jgi:hypothetical protein
MSANTLVFHKLVCLALFNELVYSSLSHSCCSVLQSLRLCYLPKIGTSSCGRTWPPDLTRKQYTRLKRLARDKRSSSLQKFVKCCRKKFYRIGSSIEFTHRSSFLAINYYLLLFYFNFCLDAVAPHHFVEHNLAERHFVEISTV